MSYGNEPVQGGEPPAQGGGGLAIASLVLGIIGLIAACVPLCGFPINLTGLILGILGLKSPNRGMAIAGTTCSAIGMVLTIISAAFGVFMALSQQKAGGGSFR
jgi:hypothetical protein